jgi:hypothetical protein
VVVQRVDIWYDEASSFRQPSVDQMTSVLSKASVQDAYSSALMMMLTQNGGLENKITDQATIERAFNLMNLTQDGTIGESIFHKELRQLEESMKAYIDRRFDELRAELLNERFKF